MVDGYWVEWWTWLWATTGFDFVEVVAAGVEVAVVAGEVAAADLYAKLFAGGEVVLVCEGWKATL